MEADCPMFIEHDWRAYYQRIKAQAMCRDISPRAIEVTRKHDSRHKKIRHCLLVAPAISGVAAKQYPEADLSAPYSTIGVCRGEAAADRKHAASLISLRAEDQSLP